MGHGTGQWDTGLGSAAQSWCHLVVSRVPVPQLDSRSGVTADGMVTLLDRQAWTHCTVWGHSRTAPEGTQPDSQNSDTARQSLQGQGKHLCAQQAMKCHWEEVAARRVHGPHTNPALSSLELSLWQLGCRDPRPRKRRSHPKDLHGL